MIKPKTTRKVTTNPRDIQERSKNKEKAIEEHPSAASGQTFQ